MNTRSPDAPDQFIQADMAHATQQEVARLVENFRWACTLDVAVRKPGNVSVASPGHGMQAAQFLASARAAAPPLCAPTLRVGARIEQAVIATQALAGCNTNLGILLLCAPIAAAMLRLAGQAASSATARDRGPADAYRWSGAGIPPRVTSLRVALQAVLHDLDQTDAAAAFRAIALANPGGLGSSPDQDVRAEPTVDLRAAMAIAAPRDRIALQYVTGFDDLFIPALPNFLAALGEPPSPARLRPAVEDVFVDFLARFPDAHIVRKHGPSLAQSVTRQAREWRNAWGSAADAERGSAHDRKRRHRALAQWDAQLKATAINPGTTADLTVATAFLAACLDPRLRELSPVGEVA